MPLLAMSSSEPFVWTRTLPKNQPQLLLRMIDTDEDVEHFAIRAEPEPPVKEISDYDGQDRNSFWIDPGDLEKILTEAANRLVGGKNPDDSSTGPPKRRRMAGEAVKT